MPRLFLGIIAALSLAACEGDAGGATTSSASSTYQTGGIAVDASYGYWSAVGAAARSST